jgi:hypothetical protein
VRKLPERRFELRGRSPAPANCFAAEATSPEVPDADPRESAGALKTPGGPDCICANLTAVDLKLADYNGSDVLFAGPLAGAWSEIESTLNAVPLHLKPSDQASKVGAPIWDPVGMNSVIKDQLLRLGWAANVPVPAAYSFLGTDVDFVKEGTIMEVQFSNYPFLLNNMLRCELFHKSKEPLAGTAICAAVIVTKAHMFDASNSTLYFEQAKMQLDELIGHSVFDVPLRLVGLTSAQGPAVPVIWTEYSAARYSRTVRARRETTADISPGRRAASRARVTVA